MYLVIWSNLTSATKILEGQNRDLKMFHKMDFNAIKLGLVVPCGLHDQPPTVNNPLVERLHELFPPEKAYPISGEPYFTTVEARQQQRLKVRGENSQ